jgi:predicted pyridoxine 5'-phosphate oxidase superfamily flavin-nucleotide-binding protein
VQHRGGPSGFLKVLDKRTLAFADFLGNVTADDRVALILMDYPNCTPLKILVHLAVRDLPYAPAQAEALALPGY